MNKLDTVGWSQERFQEITSKLSAFLRQAGFRESDVTYVPCSGLTGENMVVKPIAAELNSWYTGPCLLEVIGNFFLFHLCQICSFYFCFIPVDTFL